MATITIYCIWAHSWTRLRKPRVAASCSRGIGGYILGCTPVEREPAPQAPTEPKATQEQAEQAPEDAEAAGQYSPVKARARDFYAPNTEDLGPDEMRLIACGAGMPTARPKQAASCWLLELGNGDKFIFDVGTGSAERISALQIPYNYLDKVFLSHLHTDHFGDLDALFVGGALAGRQKPLRVWGPSAETPERGTKDEIRVRMAVVDEDVWPPPATEKPQAPDAMQRIPYSAEISGCRLDMKKILQPTYDEINKEYGIHEKQE